MPKFHELTTTDLRAELAYRERALERATSGSTAELERGIAAVRSELRRRERYTAPPAPPMLEPEPPTPLDRDELYHGLGDFDGGELS